MDPMEIRDIVLLLALAEERSFSRTAERCYISQPALSKIVKKAEQNLGVRLFDRGSSPIKVTPEGERFISLFRKLYEVHLEIENHSDALQQKQKSNLIIAAPLFFCTYALPGVIEDFKLENPGISIKLIETNNMDMIEFLQEGIVDIGISPYTKVPSELDFCLLKKETLILAVPKKFAANQGLEYAVIPSEGLCNGAFLHSDTPQIALSAFAKEKFLLLKKGNDLRERELKICADSGFEPNIAMEADSLMTAYYLAEAGKGITLTRAGILCYAGLSDNLNFYKIDHPAMSRDIRIYYVRNRVQTKIQKKFIEYLKKYPMYL